MSDPITLYRGDNEVQEFFEDGPGAVLIFRNKYEAAGGERGRWMVMLGSPLRVYGERSTGWLTPALFDNAESAMRHLYEVDGLAFTVSADEEWREQEPLMPTPADADYRWEGMRLCSVA